MNLAGISLINTATLFCQLHHAAQILADNIKLQVHYATNLKRMEVGIFIGCLLYTSPSPRDTR